MIIHYIFHVEIHLGYSYVTEILKIAHKLDLFYCQTFPRSNVLGPYHELNHCLNFIVLIDQKGKHYIYV